MRFRHVAAHRALAVTVLLTPVLAGRALGQAAGDATSPPACYGFSFGAWTPALDWRAAGHVAPMHEVAGDRAPGGRQWMVNAERGDSLMVLFPGWWPAGVTVAVGRPPHAPGDTVLGRAVALVADGRVRAPESKVRVWVVPCGGAP